VSWIIWTIINLVLGVLGWSFGNVLLGGTFTILIKLTDKIQSKGLSASLAVAMYLCFGVFNVGYPIWTIYGWWYGITHSSQAHSTESDSE
jgi:hypothetical protein